MALSFADYPYLTTCLFLLLLLLAILPVTSNEDFLIIFLFPLYPVSSSPGSHCLTQSTSPDGKWGFRESVDTAVNYKGKRSREMGESLSRFTEKALGQVRFTSLRKAPSETEFQVKVTQLFVTVDLGR